MAKYKVKRPATQLPDGTIQIQLTRGYVTIIDGEDADLAQFNWSALVSRNTVYAMRAPRDEKDKRQVFCLHQIILARVLGRELADGEQVDHRDMNGLNNTRANLRLATFTENAQNRRRRKDSSSGFKGVQWHYNKWEAILVYKGHRIWLGYFDTAEEAHAAYCKAARELFGEFARFE